MHSWSNLLVIWSQGEWVLSLDEFFHQLLSHLWRETRFQDDHYVGGCSTCGWSCWRRVARPDKRSQPSISPGFLQNIHCNKNIKDGDIAPWSVCNNLSTWLYGKIYANYPQCNPQISSRYPQDNNAKLEIKGSPTCEVYLSLWALRTQPGTLAHFIFGP